MPSGDRATLTCAATTWLTADDGPVTLTVVGVNVISPTSMPAGTVPWSTSTGTCLVVTWSSTTWIVRGCESRMVTRGSMAVTVTRTLTGCPSALTFARSTVASKSSARWRGTSARRDVPDLVDVAQVVRDLGARRLVDGGDGDRARERDAVLRGDQPHVEERREGDGPELEGPVVDDEARRPADRRADAHRLATAVAVPVPSSSATGASAGGTIGMGGLAARRRARGRGAPCREVGVPASTRAGRGADPESAARPAAEARGRAVARARAGRPAPRAGRTGPARAAPPTARARSAPARRRSSGRSPRTRRPRRRRCPR